MAGDRYRYAPPDLGRHHAGWTDHRQMWGTIDSGAADEDAKAAAVEARLSPGLRLHQYLALAAVVVALLVAALCG